MTNPSEKEIAVLIDCIQLELENLFERSISNPADATLTAETEKVRETLVRTLQSLLMKRHDWTKIESEYQIKCHLESMLGNSR